MVSDSLGLGLGLRAEVWTVCGGSNAIGKPTLPWSITLVEGIREREVELVWVVVLVALLLGGGLVSINRGLSWVVFLKLELRYISSSLLGALHIGGEVCL